MLKILRDSNTLTPAGEEQDPRSCLVAAEEPGDFRALTHYFRPTDIYLTHHSSSTDRSTADLSNPDSFVPLSDREVSINDLIDPDFKRGVSINSPRVIAIQTMSQDELDGAGLCFLGSALSSGVLQNGKRVLLDLSDSLASRRSLQSIFRVPDLPNEHVAVWDKMLGFIESFSDLWIAAVGTEAVLEIICRNTGEIPSQLEIDFSDDDLTAYFQLFGVGPTIETSVRDVAAAGFVASPFCIRMNPGDFVLIDSEICREEKARPVSDEYIASFQLTLAWRARNFGAQPKEDIAILINRISNLSKMMRSF